MINKPAYGAFRLFLYDIEKKKEKNCPLFTMKGSRKPQKGHSFHKQEKIYKLHFVIQKM